MMVMVAMMVEDERKKKKDQERRRDEDEVNQKDGKREVPTRGHCGQSTGHSLARAIVLSASCGLHTRGPPHLYFMVKKIKVKIVTCLKSPCGQHLPCDFFFFLIKSQHLHTPSLPIAPDTALGMQ